jgi:hypothetical protein
MRMEIPEKSSELGKADRMATGGPSLNTRSTAGQKNSGASCEERARTKSGRQSHGIARFATKNAGATLLLGPRFADSIPKAPRSRPMAGAEPVRHREREPLSLAQRGSCLFLYLHGRCQNDRRRRKVRNKSKRTRLCRRGPSQIYSHGTAAHWQPCRIGEKPGPHRKEVR